ncbi:hypothetical protein AXF42_Ash017831 [Apostasia shenzhenica]|uniref:Uncharacterized protein n=1 Tax=Apostasia shenzhenica TaxID=1088818 RepID=A0A2I0A3W0_9ASPA|nr:hypothetical protein AXF42_Ash017831 [Apostasia shenzhenica]
MRESESVAQMHSRFKEIYHGLVALGEILENREVVCKVLEAFPRTQLWVDKVDAIGVSQNLDTYKIDELFSLMELHKTRHGGEKEVKKGIALVAEEEVSKKPSSSHSPKLSKKAQVEISSSSESDEDSEPEVRIVAHIVRRMMRKGKKFSKNNINKIIGGSSRDRNRRNIKDYEGNNHNKNWR